MLYCFKLNVEDGERGKEFMILERRIFYNQMNNKIL